jgi:hypothetical protein
MGICVTLDRQHRRDLFDVKYLLEKEGFKEDIKKSLMLLLLSSIRPLDEMLQPNLIDQKQQWSISLKVSVLSVFKYDDIENAMATLIENIRQNLTTKGKIFLLNFSNFDS